MYSTSTDAARNVLAATFANRDDAHAAAHRLHEEGFHDAWIGNTKADDRDTTYVDESDRVSVATPVVGVDTASETRVESDNWFQRIFGEGDESLHDALVKHGVSEAEAMKARQIEPGGAILTIDGANHPELAAQIISECGGRTITSGYGASGFGTPGTYNAPTSSRGTGQAYDTAAETDQRPLTDLSMPVGATVGDNGFNETDTDVAAADRYLGYGRFRAGAEIEDERRLQLREERLRIEKERTTRGEATVGTVVVTQQENIDVPFVREELYVRRRPVDGTTADASPIGSGETIRIPLTEERVSVTKTPVVVEEVIVGKRDVADVEHISETTRREELRINDVDGATPERDTAPTTR